MKTIGLLGGMSWESTVTYYRLLNQGIRERLGGLHSAKILMHSVDFAELEELMSSGKWQQAADVLGGAAANLEHAGAELLMICTNTMHKVADQVAAAVSIPLIHIADATGRRVADDGVGRVGLLGTRFTMEEPFYRSILEDRYQVSVLIPPEPQRRMVDEVIFKELCMGIIEPRSRDAYGRIVASMKEQG
ncbi:MAG: amino acid racemase, partial [Desulfofustis sp.]|nr:amino acid racemase [Desulfofustis sp.]